MNNFKKLYFTIILLVLLIVPVRFAAAQESIFDSNVSYSYDSSNGYTFGYDEQTQITFNQPFALSQFCTSLLFPQKPEGNLTVELFDGDYVLATFSMVLCESSFDAVTKIDGRELKADNLSYRDGNSVQLRIMKEDILNFETGRNEKKWAVRVNNSSETVSAQSENSAISNFLESNADRQLKMRLKHDVMQSMSIFRLADKHFYDYRTIENGVTITELSYEKVKFSWTIPENIDKQTFNVLNVTRFTNGEVDNVQNFGNTVLSYSAQRLFQDSDYSFKIIAYDNYDRRSTLCPKIAFAYEEFQIHTLKGNALPYILWATAALLTIIILILLYAFYPKIKAKFNRKQ